MPSLLRMCHFARAYPGWYLDRRRWRTRDGVIPWKTFEIMYQGIWATMALDRLSMAKAIGLAFADTKNAQGREVMQKELGEAYPKPPEA